MVCLWRKGLLETLSEAPGQGRRHAPERTALPGLRRHSFQDTCNHSSFSSVGLSVLNLTHRLLSSIDEGWSKGQQGDRRRESGAQQQGLQLKQDSIHLLGQEMYSRLRCSAGEAQASMIDSVLVLD